MHCPEVVCSTWQHPHLAQNSTEQPKGKQILHSSYGAPQKAPSEPLQNPHSSREDSRPEPNSAVPLPEMTRDQRGGCGGKKKGNKQKLHPPSTHYNNSKVDDPSAPPIITVSHPKWELF